MGKRSFPQIKFFFFFLFFCSCNHRFERYPVLTVREEKDGEREVNWTLNIQNTDAVRKHSQVLTVKIAPGYSLYTREHLISPFCRLTELPMVTVIVSTTQGKKGGMVY